MFVLIKHRIIKIIEKIPLFQIFVYNNLQYFKFLFPHDKDYYALKLLFNKNEKRTFLDIGGNIGLSTIGFRELGFFKNKIIMFEPDRFLLDNYVSKVTKNYPNITVYPFGLGLGSILAAFSQSTEMLGLSLGILGFFAAIYHPVGIAMIVKRPGKVGLRLGINGVWGNMGVALAPILTGFLIAYADWRLGFLIPSIMCLLFGISQLFAFIEQNETLICKLPN